MLRSGIILFLIPTVLIFLHTSELATLTGSLVQAFCYLSYTLSLLFILGTLSLHLYLDYKRDKWIASHQPQRVRWHHPV